ncbi:unnamed protein product, partial [Mesorhabditis spiculigera]
MRISQRKYAEIYEVLSLTLVIFAAFFVISNIAKLKLPVVSNVYLDDRTQTFWVNFLYNNTTVMIQFISIITNPIAIYLTAINRKIVWPVRLLLISEAFGRFMMSLSQMFLFGGIVLVNFCTATGLTSLIPIFVQVLFFGSTLWENLMTLSTGIRLAQYFVSLGRFIALSFNGRYFPYALKFPYAQLILPYTLSLFLRLARVFHIDLGSFPDYLEDILLSKAASMDFFAYRKLKTHSFCGF